MYIYLSERKRRMFLSLSLPQNLSPKKPSPKDLRFLQKYVGNTTVPLSLPLIKQQKKLYEKHIHFPLKNTLSIFAMQKQMIEPVDNLNENRVFFGNGAQPPLYASLWQKCQQYNFIDYSQRLNHEFYRKQKGLFVEKLHTHSNTYKTLSFTSMVCHRQPQTVLLPDKHFGQDLACQRKAKSKKPMQSIGISAGKISYKLYPKNYSIKKKGHCYEKPYMEPVLSQPLLSNALCIYTQTVKVKQKPHASTGYGNLTYGKGYNDLFFEKSCIIKKGLYAFEKMPDILQKLASPPLFVNGQNKYWFCRFLYNREHIKLSISPQIVQNQKKHQKGAKTKYIHEKKKIALFYGQIAKKDLYTLSKNAQSLPGGFEENMYTLLESRIDVCLHRAGFSKTIAMARQLIRQGLVFVNGKKINSCKVCGKPGDIIILDSQKSVDNINFCYKYTTKSLYNIHVSQTFKKFPKRVSASYNTQNAAYANQAPKQRYKENILRELCRGGFLNSTHSLSGQYWLDKKQHITGSLFKKQNLHGYLYPGFFLYKNLCKKTRPPFFSEGLPWQKNTQHTLSFRALYSNKAVTKKTKAETSMFLNTYIVYILKCKSKTRNSFMVHKKKENIFTPVMKNIQNANCASFWGQKPLNLEISHKMLCFIYLYPPQKIISPICIDFNALKF